MKSRKKTEKTTTEPKKEHPIPDGPKTIVQHIQAISDAGDEIGSLEDLMLKVPESVKFVAAYLKCSDVQATIFSLIFAMNFVEVSIDLEDLATFMKCNPLNLGARIDDFDELINMRLIRKEPVDASRYRRQFPQSWSYHILPELFEPILHGESLTRTEARVDSMFLLLENIQQSIDHCYNGTYSFGEMEREVLSVMGENEHLPFVKNIKNLHLSNGSLYMLLYMCSGLIQGVERISLPSMLKSIFPSLMDQLEIRRSLMKGKHELQKKELASLEESLFLSDREMSISERCVDMLFSEEDIILSGNNEKKKPGIIDFHDIPEKQLFFCDGQKKSLEFLEEVLKPYNYTKLISRLEEKHMPKGVSILLYGAPGTGKTESVYQIARRTGRDIHQVVISETKSKWFGDSEKLIKKIFDKYRNLVELKEVTPILLFNEADGIFSRRKGTNHSAVDQTENAVQNIILQEMEDLDGILIATTNMAGNLDQAFERRFLYKICFEKPTAEARFQIWKNKIPSLTEDETARLSDKFHFSGGQIDNIARKCIMKEVLHDMSPNIDDLIDYCSEENLQQSVQRIGFRK